MRWIQVSAWSGVKTIPAYIPADEIGYVSGPVDGGKASNGNPATEVALRGTPHRESLLVVEPPEVVLARAGAALDEDGRALPWQLYSATTNDVGRLVRVEFRAGNQRVQLVAIEGPQTVEED